MISKEEVQKIAKLARLELTDEEIKKMQKDLSSILDYFEILKKITQVTEITKESTGIDIIRADETIERPTNLADTLVQSAPDKKDKYIKVKAILQ